MIVVVYSWLLGIVLGLLVYYFRAFRYYKKQSDLYFKVIDNFVKYGTKC